MCGNWQKIETNRGKSTQIDKKNGEENELKNGQNIDQNRQENCKKRMQLKNNRYLVNNPYLN